MRRSTTIIAGLVLAAAPAFADVISPEEDACRGKTQGAACSADGRDGTCQPDECCRNDYSNGVPPQTVCGDCFTCKAGAAASGGSDDEKGCAAAPGGALGAGSLLAGLALAFGLWRTRRRA
ncbi:MAG: hypothetical protein KC613_28450 [Myxococcales bacterium]|nr:hypothetical protein [Myxococcales bacterium]MCB9522957.1 hypothetical protein [Myxococcales bacterium]